MTGGHKLLIVKVVATVAEGRQERGRCHDRTTTGNTKNLMKRVNVARKARFLVRSFDVESGTMPHVFSCIEINGAAKALFHYGVSCF